MAETVTEILHYTVVANANVVELIWLISNVLGIIASVCAAILADGDMRRAAFGTAKDGEGGKARALRERNGVMVLGNEAATNERLKGLIHLGHGAIGIVVVAAPDPVRPAMTLAILSVTIWLLASSVLLFLTTILHLKARYNYREVRRSGRRATWWRATRDTGVEVGLEFRRSWRRMGRRPAA